VPNVEWKTPDDGQRKYPKHVEFLDKNKFFEISASVGFIKNKYLIHPLTNYVLTKAAGIYYPTAHTHSSIKQNTGKRIQNQQQVIGYSLRTLSVKFLFRRLSVSQGLCPIQFLLKLVNIYVTT